MKILVPEEFNNFADYNALFFANDGILVDPQKNTGFITFYEGIKHFNIKSAALQNDIIIVQGQAIPLSPFYHCEYIK